MTKVQMPCPAGISPSVIGPPNPFARICTFDDVVNVKTVRSATPRGFRAVSYATADTISWWQRTRGEGDDLLVAYFSMEFGIHERLPIYSGGLSVLAGDHA